MQSRRSFHARVGIPALALFTWLNAGSLALAGDPDHKIINPVLYNVPQVMACWRRVTADVLLVFAHGDERWNRFETSAEYRDRMKALRSLVTVTVEGAGHMLHHDQPEAIARLVEEFIR